LNLVSGDDTHLGWIVGVGAEHAITPNTLIRIEYSHMDFGSETHNLTFAGGGPTIPTEVEATFDSLKIGVSYKF